ncbi:proline-rich extensin-like protein EPR1 [Girardinichthys multiradiatus]|uniref:proline-rich extensin-like protein EPR1 n=1 Tax=Girardinichthys multiradiatus TaxID=208333 RepID=UPI001FAB811B|nr:proline-rich extensin-like protein EPR1 [Girardinichthys multiradiatus]
MGFLLRLVVASLLTVETWKVKALYMPSMAVEPVFPVGNPSKPHTTLEELSYAPWLPMPPLALPQQKPDIDEHQFPNEPKFPLGLVHEVHRPMLPFEPKYLVGGPIPQVKPPWFPGKPPCSFVSPASPCRPPVYPVEPKYPIGGPVPQVKPPWFPGKPPCLFGSLAGPCRPPVYPVEPKYPIGGPVPQVQPLRLPVEPNYPIGGLVPQVVPPQFPGKPPCSTGSPAGSCRPPIFPFGPNYPIQGPVGHGLEHLLLVNLEPPKTHEDPFYHGYPPKSLGCWSKWPFLPSRPC